MTVDLQQWHRVWYEIGKLEAIVEGLQKQVRELERDGLVIDQTPEPVRPRNHGNVTYLPGVTPTPPRKSRRSPRSKDPTE
jgi:hypothetical protein